MKQLFFGLLTNVFLTTSCKTLKSTTYINSNDAFVLGTNEHGQFNVRLKNNSRNDLVLWRTPITGGQHSPLTVKPKETVKVGVEKNTALRIKNNNNEQATVELFVKGDTGLSMGYKN